MFRVSTYGVRSVAVSSSVTRTAADLVLSSFPCGGAPRLCTKGMACEVPDALPADAERLRGPARE
jgi:hypothetical protein